MKLLQLTGLGLLVALLGFTLAGCAAGPVGQTTTSATAENDATASFAPPINVKTIEGDDFTLNENGRPAVVYFMASWCSSCAKNWEALNEVYPEYQDRVDFIGISVDPTDSDAVLQELAADKGFVFETSAGNPELAVAYDVKKQTAKFAVDGQGNIVSRHGGVLTAQEWRDLFESLVTSDASPQEVSFSAPPVNVQTIEGEDFSLETGTPAVVYFMASSCSSCAKNWEALNAVYPDYEGRVDFIAVSVDPTDSNEVLQELAAEKEFAFDSSAGNPQLALDYEVKKQTAKFAIDAEGNIVSRHDGVLTEQEWRDLFESLLGPETTLSSPEIVEQTAVQNEVLFSAPPVNVQTIEGESFALEDGTPAVVYFMASSCSSCAKNWEALNAVYPDYEGRVDFIAVSVDPTDSDAVLQELAADKGFVFDSSAGNPQLALDYEVKKQTAKFAIDADGNVVSRHDGVLSEQEWRELFDSLL